MEPNTSYPFSILSFEMNVCFTLTVHLSSDQTHFKCVMWPHVAHGYYIGQCSLIKFLLTILFFFCRKSYLKFLRSDAEVILFHILLGNTTFIIYNTPWGSGAALHDQTNISVAKIVTLHSK